MAWYCRNATASRFGATRKCLDTSDATGSATATVADGGATVTVSIQAVTSAGANSGSAYSGNTTIALGTSATNKTISVMVGSDGAVPDSGGVRVTISPFSESWYTPAETGSEVIKAGTHNFTVKLSHLYNEGEDTNDVTLYYGNQQSYGPDAIFEAAASPDATVTVTAGSAVASGTSTTASGTDLRGPWYYDLSLLVAETSATVSVTAGSATAAGTATATSVVGAIVSVIAGSAVASGTTTTATGEIVGGPWSYDLSLLPIVNAAVTVSAGLSDATGRLSCARALETGDDDWSGLAIVSGTSYSDVDVRPGTTYEYRISTIGTTDYAYSNQVNSGYSVNTTAGSAIAQGYPVTASASSATIVTVTAGSAVASGSATSTAVATTVTISAGVASGLGTNASTAVTSGETVTVNVGYAFAYGTVTTSSADNDVLVSVTAGEAAAAGTAVTITGGFSATVDIYTLSGSSRARAAGQLIVTVTGTVTAAVTVTAGVAYGLGATAGATGDFNAVVITAGSAIASGEICGIVNDIKATCLSGYAAAEGSTARSSPAVWDERAGSATAWTEKAASTSSWTLRY